MRLAVTGRTGQVASCLLEVGPARGVEVVTLARPSFDLAAPEGVAEALAASGADAVVSAAAYTAVDKAETEPEAAEAVNATGPGRLAAAAAALGLPVVHLSTDYVFPGTKAGPYLETDETGPTGVYGATKLAGERAVAAGQPRSVILRTAWVYSPFGANFVRTMLKIGETNGEVRVVADQIGNPTSALDIAAAVIDVSRALLARPEDPTLTGVFHMAGGGDASWADFADAIFAGAARRGRSPVTVHRITTAEFPRPARRPANSRLDCGRLKAVHGVRLPAWRSSLEVVLDRLLPG